MTINKKIATSIAASTVLAGSLMAATGNGTIKMSDGDSSAVIAEELYQLNNEVNASLSPTSGSYWIYTADLDGSGTVSDAAVNLTFSTGIARSGANDTFYILDLGDGNNTIAKEISYNSTTNEVKFDSDSAYTFSNGGQYAIVAIDADVALGTAQDPGVNASTTVKMLGGKTTHENATADLELWSTSGTEVLRDKASADLFDVTPQYSVYCENKIDNLINVENTSYTFVSTKHGALDTADGSAGDVMNVLRDIMSFKVVKTAVDYGLDGNSSVMNIVADNNTTFFTLLNDANSDITHNFGSTGQSINPDAKSGGTSDINVTHDDTGTGFAGLGASTNTYTVAFDVNGSYAIPETTFTANFYVHDSALDVVADTNTTYTPAGTYEAGKTVGKWTKFAYIAQVAGATETSATRTKFFITNRSCATVTPKMTLIYGGKTVTFDLDQLAVDTQMKINLEDAIAANQAAIVAAGLPTTGRFSVELTMSGNAEDFYVYAQAQSKTDIAATKDLPVYNTSTRD